MEVTFRNVQVTISGADSAEDAYERLCNALATVEDGVADVEWQTDTYEALGSDGTVERGVTTALMPEETM